MQALVLSAVPLVFLVLLAILTALLVSQAQTISSASQQATRILSQSDAMVAVISAAAAGITDYAGGAHAKGLSNYRRYAARFPAAARTLLALTAREPKQRAYARRYVGLSSEGMTVLARYLAMVRTGQNARARAYGTSPAVRRLSLALTAAKNGFDRNERALTMDRFDEFSKRLRFVLAMTLLLCIVGIGCTIAATTGFGIRIVERLEVLARNVRLLGAGESVSSIGGDDEIAMLDRLYQEITDRLRNALHQKEELLAAYEREHHVASTLQQALLPQELPVLRGLRIDAAYLSAAKTAEVGGDWYDVFMLSDRLLGIGVGDVAGHDLQAATIMGSVRQAIRMAAREDSDPATILSRVNRSLCVDGEHRMVTAFFGVLDRLEGTLRYAMAGHPPPMLVTPERDIRLLPGSGVALGINRRFDYATFETHVGLGSALVLYTDGVVEAERDYDKGMASLEAAVRAEAFSVGGNIAHQIQERAFGGVEPADDSALLFIGVTDLSAAHIAPHCLAWHFDAKDESAAHRVKRALMWQLGELASSTSDFASAEAIIGELISNVARHTPGDADVTLEYDESAVTLRVHDRGKAFKSTGEHVPDVLAESGRGLFLVRSLSRRFDVEHASDGNRISVVLPVAITLPTNVSAA